MITRFKHKVKLQMKRVAKSFLTPDERESLNVGAYAREWVLP